MDINSMIELLVKMRHGYIPHICWIAKESTGLEVKLAPNRMEIEMHSDSCPPHKLNDIMDALRHFELIK